MSKVFFQQFVAHHFNEYLQLSDLLPSLQSSFWPNNLTEKAVLRVLSDLMEAVCSGDVAVCLLLSILSNVDHSILCQRLELSWTSIFSVISPQSFTVCSLWHAWIIICPAHLQGSAMLSPRLSLVHHVYC